MRFLINQHQVLESPFTHSVLPNSRTLTGNDLGLRAFRCYLGITTVGNPFCPIRSRLINLLFHWLSLIILIVK